MTKKIRIIDNFNNHHGDITVAETYPILPGYAQVIDIKTTDNENIKFLRDASQVEELKDVDLIIVLTRKEQGS